MRSQKQWTERAAFMDQLAAEAFVILGGPIADSGDILLAVDAPNEMKFARLCRAIPGVSRDYCIFDRFSDGPSCSNQRSDRLIQNASIPVTLCPMIKVWMSCVPS